MKVTIDKEDFLIDGKKTKIISGAIHYFRVVPEYWYDRLAKLKACGFNTVETYMAWNLHEENEGEFNFEGMMDIVSRHIPIGEIASMATASPEYSFGEMFLNLFPTSIVQAMADGNLLQIVVFSIFLHNF